MVMRGFVAGLAMVALTMAASAGRAGEAGIGVIQVRNRSNWTVDIYLRQADIEGAPSGFVGRLAPRKTLKLEHLPVLRYYEVKAIPDAAAIIEPFQCVLDPRQPRETWTIEGPR